MRRITLGCLGLVLLAAAGCGTAFRATGSVATAQPWREYARVEVRVANGSVDLSAGDAKEITISGEKFAGGTTLAEAEANVEQVEIYAGAAKDHPETFLVELRYPEPLRYKNVGAKLHIELPRACPANVETINGAIRAARLEGDVVLRTSNGSIDVSDVKGPVRAQSSNGAIEARDIAGSIQAHTSNGRIFVQRASAADLKTTNGAVVASNVNGDLSATTSNGHIEASVSPPADGRVNLQTSNGAIRLSLPAALGIDLRLITSNGRIHTGLDENAFQAGHRSKTHVEGRLNGGGCRVDATTSNGSITFDAR